MPEHQVRVAHTEAGYRAECVTCEWRSLWEANTDVAWFFARRHQQRPEQP